MKKLSISIPVLLCLMLIFSCKKESDPEPSLAERIIGTWTINSTLYTECDSGDDWEEVFTCDVHCTKFTFNEGGEYIYINYENGLPTGQSDPEEYSITDGILSFGNSVNLLSFENGKMIWVGGQDYNCKTITSLSKN